MSDLHQAIETTSKDLSNHPIVAAIIIVLHILIAWFANFVGAIYNLHIPPIITEVFQNLCYIGGISVSAMTVYPSIKPRLKKLFKLK